MSMSNPLREAITLADDEWYAAYEMCGGCGSDDCHAGPCKGHVCLVCPERIATGEAAAGRRF